MKKKLYFVEVDSVYSNFEKKLKLPYSTGLIWSYCLQNQEIKNNYELADWICYRDDIDVVFDKI